MMQSKENSNTRLFSWVSTLFCNFTLPLGSITQRNRKKTPHDRYRNFPTDVVHAWRASRTARHNKIVMKVQIWKADLPKNFSLVLHSVVLHSSLQQHVLWGSFCFFSAHGLPFLKIHYPFQDDGTALCGASRTNPDTKWSFFLPDYFSSDQFLKLVHSVTQAAVQGGWTEWAKAMGYQLDQLSCKCKVAEK